MGFGVQMANTLNRLSTQDHYVNYKAQKRHYMSAFALLNEGGDTMAALLQVSCVWNLLTQVKSNISILSCT